MAHDVFILLTVREKHDARLPTRCSINMFLTTLAFVPQDGEFLSNLKIEHYRPHLGQVRFRISSTYIMVQLKEAAPKI